MRIQSLQESRVIGWSDDSLLRFQEKDVAIKNVMVELERSPELETAFSAAQIDAASAPLTAVTGFKLDTAFAPVLIPSLTAPSNASTAAPDSAMVPEFNSDTVIVRGTVDDDAFDFAQVVANAATGVRGVYADPVIEPFATCGPHAVGTATDVARLIDSVSLRRARMDGRGTLLAIVDTGVNIEYLRRVTGFTPGFSVERSWVPPLQPGQLPMTPGAMAIGHGTMCAFDALIGAPRATLLDIAILASRRPGGSVMDGLLSDAVLGFSHLLRIMRALGRPGDYHSLVVNNSWGMFQRSWDFPPNHPGNYSHNPNHPFNRIVGTLERSGADILFAAGNCGSECPDRRCGSEANAGIFGANSHPAVLTVAGVDATNQRRGYSTRGPGHLDEKKPDIAGYTHFKGSGVYPADGGTSAATPVVAGVLAAFRSRFPTGPGRTPAVLRDLVRRTASDIGPPGFDFETGYGIVNGSRLARSVLTMADADDVDTVEDDADMDDSGLGDARAEPFDDRDFLAALRAFESPAAGTAVQAEPCWSCSEQQQKPSIKEVVMNSNSDQEFMQALQAFGGTGGDFGGGTATDFGDAEMSMDFADAGDDGGDAEFMQALQAFGGTTGGLQGAGMYGASVDVAAAPSLADVCRVWRSVRPIVLRILPFVAALPGVGGAVARAFRTLSSLLDTVCRGGPGGASALCQRWNQGLRVVVVRVAVVVSRIPFIGGAAARALRALIAAIDAACRGA